jgi:hypothetical protein
MRRAAIWLCSVFGFSVALFAAFGLSWGCALQRPGTHDLFCSFTSQRLGIPLILGAIIGGHTLASVLAVTISPTRRRIIGILAVALPLIFWVSTAILMTREPFNPVMAVLVPVLMAIPVAACMVLFIRRLERRRASVA